MTGVESVTDELSPSRPLRPASPIGVDNVRAEARLEAADLMVDEWTVNGAEFGLGDDEVNPGVDTGPGAVDTATLNTWMRASTSC